MHVGEPGVQDLAVAAAEARIAEAHGLLEVGVDGDPDVDPAARHDVFDEAVLRLWRAKRVRLTPISDHARATPDQLRDAIPGMGEMLFYLEAARDPAAV